MFVKKSLGKHDIKSSNNFLPTTTKKKKGEINQQSIRWFAAVFESTGFFIGQSGKRVRSHK